MTSILNSLGQMFGVGGAIMSGYAQDQREQDARAIRAAELARQQQLDNRSIANDDFEHDYRLRMAGYLPASSTPTTGAAAAPTVPGAQPSASPQTPHGPMLNALGQYFVGGKATGIPAPVGPRLAQIAAQSPPSTTPPVTVPFSGGPRTYNFDYEHSPAGMIEARQASRDAEHAQLAAQARSLANKRAYNTLRIQFASDPLAKAPYDDDTDYTQGIREAQAAARDQRRDDRQTTRDTNVSASAATDRAIAQNTRQANALTKSMPSFSQFSMNPAADSAAVIAGRQQPLMALGNLAVRGDSLRRAGDQQAAAIGSGQRTPGAINMGPQRAALADAQQKLTFLMNNPKVSTADKAKAQAAYRARIERIMVGADDQ